jgi:hypothetical protein
MGVGYGGDRVSMDEIVMAKDFDKNCTALLL